MYQRFMGHSHPIDSIDLSVHSQYIIAIYKGSDGLKNFMYKGDGASCKVSCGINEETRENSNFIDEFLKDLEIILSDPNLSLTSFWLGTRELRNTNYSKILEALKPILESRESPLRVKTWIMDVLDSNQISLILPYLDSSILKIVRIHDPASHDNWRLGPVREDAKSEQWKKSKLLTVYISTARFPNTLKHFLRFSSLVAYVDGMKIEEMRELAQTFIHSPFMNYFCLNFDVFENQKLFLDYLGPSSTIKDYWYFRMTKSSDVLRITSEVQSQRIEFQRISASEVPDDVVIQDGTLL